MIFSQPDQYAVDPTHGNVRAYWEWFLHEKRGGKKIRETGQTIGAYVSASRWIADCPACNGGIACWDQNPLGCCLTCGSLYKIVFPKDHLVAEEILNARPPGNRHWFPHKGETIRQLEAENKAHVDELGPPKLNELYPGGVAAAVRAAGV